MLTPVAAFWVLLVWLVAMGAAIGSFLNVVVYRLPLGLSLVYPPSRCPKCGNHIAWYDNVPVLGWIVLRGRCRQCHNPISSRYPIVEAFTALMFGAVAVVEFPYMGRIGFYGLYPYHMLLLCTLLCAALIEYDGNRVPWRLFAPALIVGIIAPLIWPALRPICGGHEALWWNNLPGWLQGCLSGLAGLIVGAIWALLALRTLGSTYAKGLSFGLLCVGVFLGRQIVTDVAAGIILLVAPMWLLGFLSFLRRIPGTVILGIIILSWIIVGQPIFLFY
jgi:leader peptidase (prepilin peptidase)/N-methyltransferase